MRVDQDGWLLTDQVGDPEFQMVPSRANYALQVPAPLGVIWHTTDTPPTRTALSMAQNIVDPALKRSWHILIATDGKLYQSVPFTLGSWHTGQAGTIGGKAMSNVNRASVGVEIQNAGRVRLLDGKYFMYPYWKRGEDGKVDRTLGLDPALVIDPSTVAKDNAGGYWQKFTPEQVSAAEALVRALAAWKPELGQAGAYRYGHVNFPGKTGKEDPGKLWPPILENILARVFGAGAGGGGGLVAAALLFFIGWGLS